MSSGARSLLHHVRLKLEQPREIDGLTFLTFREFPSCGGERLAAFSVAVAVIGEALSL